MAVKEVLERIMKYHRFVQKGQLYGMIIFFVYMGVWYYLYYKLIFGVKIVWAFIIFMAVLYVTLGLIVLPILYKKLYYNDINRIKKNLEELKEFEES
jgi:low affinity Fe/Cu permease